MHRRATNTIIVTVRIREGYRGRETEREIERERAGNRVREIENETHKMVLAKRYNSIIDYHSLIRYANGIYGANRTGTRLISPCIPLNFNVATNVF